MKIFFIKAAILCILLLIPIAALILLSPLPENSYTLAVIEKNRILTNTESPRIVLAGGSSLAFGVDSAMIQNTLHIPVINMGVHAGFGMGRILDDILPSLRSGDILLILPEYEHFANYWNGTEAAYCLIFDAQRYRLLASSRYGLPSNFLAYLKTHLEAIITRYRGILPSPLAYSRDGFNEYGDYIKHLTMENGAIAPHENVGSLNPAHIASFFKFIDFFTKHGITVVLSYPSYEEQSYRNSTAFIEELDAILRKKENLLVISNPETYCFPAGFFHDSAYHLNVEGRNLRTKQLLKDLQASGLFD